MNRRAFVGILMTAVVGLTRTAAAQGGPPPGRGPRWTQDAEKEFRLGPGMGPKLMTEEEWKEHQTKMRTLKGPERDAYRLEMHEKMVARAKERGVEPGPGRGPAPGK